VNEFIINSRGDQGVVRSMIIGFEVQEAEPRSGVGPTNDHIPAFLFVNLVNDKQIPFEVASTDAELAPLVERFRKLFEVDILAALEERMKYWLSRWHIVPNNLQEAVEDIYKTIFEGGE